MKNRIHPALLPAALVLLGGLASAFLKDFETAPPSPLKRTWKVLVLDRETGKPVPEAQVFLLDETQALSRSLVERRTPLVRLEELEKSLLTPRPAVTDPKGLAWIPPFPGERGLLLCRKGKRKGVWYSPSFPFKRMIQVEIGPPVLLEARVVDSGGRPLEGVPLVLFPEEKEVSANPQLGIWTQTRGPGGTATFELFPGMLPRVGKESSGLLLVDLPFQSPLERKVSLRPLSPGPIELALPPTGSLEIHFLERDGRPCRTNLEVEVHGYVETVELLDEGAEEKPAVPPPAPGPSAVRLKPSPIPFASLAEEAPSRLTTSSGKIVLPWVGLGMGFRIVAYRLLQSGIRAARVETDIYGPTSSQKKFLLRAVLPSFHEVTLKGKVRAPRGGPLEEAPLSWRLVTSRAGISKSVEGRLRTGPRGDFSCPLAQGSLTSGKVYFQVAEIGRFSPRRGPYLPLPPGKNGTVDLGDISLEENTLLASGVVVGDRGEPIEDACVLAYRQSGGLIPPPLSKEPPLSVAYSGKDGTFALYSSHTAGKIVLDVKKENWLQEEEPLVAAGTKDVKIRLFGTGSLEGTVLAPPGIPLSGFHVFIHGTAGEPGTSAIKKPPLREEVDEQGRFRFSKLIPGKYEMSVVFHRPCRLYESILISWIRDIQVPRGGRCLDPRVRVIDARKKIMSFRLQLESPLGPGLFQASLRFGRNLKKRAVFFSGDKIILPAEEAGPARVECPGFLPKKIVLPPASSKIHLQPVYKLHFVSTGDSRLPKPPEYLGIHLEPLDSTTRSNSPFLPYYPCYLFRNGKDLYASASRPGRYRIMWLLVDTPDLFSSSGSFPIIPFPRKDSPIIEVKDTKKIQTFQIRLPKWPPKPSKKKHR